MVCQSRLNHILVLINYPQIDRFRRKVAAHYINIVTPGVI